MATRKWTKQQRAEASENAKKRMAARKKRDVRLNTVEDQPSAMYASGGSASSPTYVSANQATAIDVVKLIAHDVPADVIVKVVERILR